MKLNNCWCPFPLLWCISPDEPLVLWQEEFEDTKRTIQPISVHIPYVFRHLNRWSWNTFWGPSWPWWYGRWIYNYLSDQRLSPLLWVRISTRTRCTTLCNKVCQWLAYIVTGKQDHGWHTQQQYVVILVNT